MWALARVYILKNYVNIQVESRLCKFENFCCPGSNIFASSACSRGCVFEEWLLGVLKSAEVERKEWILQGVGFRSSNRGSE